MLPIVLGVIAFIILAILITSYVCFRMVFYSKNRKPLAEGELDVPTGGDFDEYRQQIENWILEARATPYESLEIKSFDGLTLKGKYYEKFKGAPVEIMFHGYHGTGERDLSGGLERCFALKRNAIIIDQRAAGSSDGNVISFCVNESLDLLSWVDFAIKKFGDDVKIILTGISMGGATVLTATGFDLPKNVLYVLSDCAYSSPKGIIKKVIKEMKLSPNFFFPFVRLGGIIFGRFDVQKRSPISAIENCSVPVIFFHGNKDDLVPCDMSKEVYEKCKTPKKLVIIEGAGHGLSYPKAPQKYLDEIEEFEKSLGISY